MKPASYRLSPAALAAARAATGLPYPGAYAGDDTFWLPGVPDLASIPFGDVPEARFEVANTTPSCTAAPYALSSLVDATFARGEHTDVVTPLDETDDRHPRAVAYARKFMASVGRLPAAAPYFDSRRGALTCVAHALARGLRLSGEKTLAPLLQSIGVTYVEALPYLEAAAARGLGPADYIGAPLEALYRRNQAEEARRRQAEARAEAERRKPMTVST